MLLTRIKNTFPWLTGLAVTLSLICAVGCSSIPDSEPAGVEKISPPGELWSATADLDWAHNSSELTASWSKDIPNTSISQSHIYILDAVNHTARVLQNTQITGTLVNLSWSPVSQEIAVTSYAWEPYGIWIVDADDLIPPHFVTPGADCVWSPDGQRLAVAQLLRKDKNGRPMLFDYVVKIIDPKTQDSQQVFQFSAPADYNIGPTGLSWSTQGNQLALAFMMNNDMASQHLAKLFIVDLDLGTAQQVMEAPVYLESPTWSPDGTKLAFIYGDIIAIMNMEDKATVYPLKLSLVFNVTWAPDGNKIAFLWEKDIYTDYA